MKMIYILASLISTIQGFLLLTILIPKDLRPAMPLFIFSGSLLGIASTTTLTFGSFILFNALIPGLAIALNVLFTVGLFFLARQRNLANPFAKGNWDKIDLIGLHLIMLAHMPVVLYAIAHPDKDCNITHALFLPLINMWASCFSHTVNHSALLITACRLSLILSGILFFSVKGSVEKTVFGSRKN